MIAILLCIMLDWNQVFLRDPVGGTAKKKVDPMPSTACFCTACDPCTCRDGKHSVGCPDGRKAPKAPETPKVNESPKVEQSFVPVYKNPTYQLKGGSGTVWQHADYGYLVTWISLNDPVCVGGNCAK